MESFLGMKSVQPQQPQRSPSQTATQTASTGSGTPRSSTGTADDRGSGTPTTVGSEKAVAPRTALWLAAAVAVGLLGWGASSLVSGNSDSVSDATKAQWQASFAAASPLVPNLVPKAEVDQAVKTMQLPPQQEQQLRTELEEGRTRMVWLSFQDVVAEDNDTVDVVSGSFRQRVVTKRQPIKVYLPEPADGFVKVIGVADGGGGITVRIVSGGVTVQMPFMVKDQVVGIRTIPAP